MSKEDLKQAAIFTLAIMLFAFVIMVMLIGTQILGEYLTYDQKHSEGYNVRFNDWECQIKMENQNGGTKWMQCRSIGNEYAWENFAIKRGLTQN